jgi:hypothetical protein
VTYAEIMDRLQGIQKHEAGWITRLLYRAFQKRLGLVPKSKMLTAYHTPTLLATSWMDALAARVGKVPLVLKELAQLKTAMLAGCPF